MFLGYLYLKVIYTLSDLTSCLPKYVVKKMEKVDNPKGIVHYENNDPDKPKGDVAYKGIEFFICEPRFKRDQRRFYARARLDDDLPEWLCNLRCEVEISGSESGPIPGVETILPQPEGTTSRRPADYDLSVRVKSDCWAGLKKACEIIGQKRLSERIAR